MSELDILLIFHIIKWKLTWGRNNDPKVALFDLSGNNLAIRVPFNRRSWVTRFPKIFKKLRECVFLPGKSNFVVFFQKIIINHENRVNNRLFFNFSRG